MLLIRAWLIFISILIFNNSNHWSVVFSFFTQTLNIKNPGSLKSVLNKDGSEEISGLLGLLLLSVSFLPYFLNCKYIIYALSPYEVAYLHMRQIGSLVSVVPVFTALSTLFWSPPARLYQYLALQQLNALFTSLPFGAGKVAHNVFLELFAACCICTH